MEWRIERKLKQGLEKTIKANLLNMELKDFLEYTELYKDKRYAFRLARSLLGNLSYKEGVYYSMGKRKVKDLYTLTAEDVFLRMKNYGVKTVGALNEILIQNYLPVLPLSLDDISYHPYYRQLRRI